MMKVWNVWLIFTTFMLSIFGTLLTRSGIVSSVHAFAQSGIGTWFTGDFGWTGDAWHSIPYIYPGFIEIIFAVCLWFYLKNRKHLQSENKLESLVSRESSFLFNNLVLLAACFAVLCGTLFPILSESCPGYKITVGAPFFNKMMIPIGLFLISLTGWAIAGVAKHVNGQPEKKLCHPCGTGAGDGHCAAAACVSPRGDMAHFYSWLTFVLSTLVIGTIASEFIRGGTCAARQIADQHLSRHVSPDTAQYAPLWRICCSLRRGAGGDRRGWSAFNLEKEQEMGHGR